MSAFDCELCCYDLKNKQTFSSGCALVLFLWPGHNQIRQWKIFCLF